MATLADALVGQGLLNPDQLQFCLGLKGRSGEPLAAVAIGQGLATGRQLLDLLSVCAEPIEDFVPEALSPQLAQLVPEEVARALRCLPVHDNGAVLDVAFANEIDNLELEKLSSHTGRQIQPFLADPSALEAAYGLLYPHEQAPAEGAAAGEGGVEGVALDEGAASGGVEGAPAEAAAEGDGDSGEGGIEGLNLTGGGEAAAEGGEAEGGGEGEGEGEAVPEIADFQGVMSGALEEEVKLVEEDKDHASAHAIQIEANSPPVVKLVNGILIRALNLRASDIHIEPQEHELRVRLRVDGEMHLLMRLPKAVSQKMVTRIKIMAELNITEKRLPQDGRFKVQLGAQSKVEFRLSTMPSAFGEKIVMRVLGGNKLKGDVSTMGFSPRDQECVSGALKGSWGLILVTGPTGSGKTTSLYTMLKALNSPNRNVVTAEDPIEYNLPGLTQVPVNPVTGFTFERALRAFLRQDPDVILVGEIRDAETAETAAKAAMTGHLVLSTLHTNDAPSTVLRLKQMGVSPFLLSASIRLVIAQRLVRVLCPSCKAPAPLSEEEKAFLKPGEAERLPAVYRGRGCDECSRIGYRGRRPVFEVMTIASAKMRAAILESSGSMVETIAREEGMRPLRESALDLAADGTTSFAEALKVGA